MSGQSMRRAAIHTTLRPDTQSDEIESYCPLGGRLSTSPSFVLGLTEASRVSGRDPGLARAWLAFLRDALHVHRFRTVNATANCGHHFPVVDIVTMQVGVGDTPHEYNEAGEPLCRFLIYSACRCGKRKVTPKWAAGETEIGNREL